MLHKFNSFTKNEDGAVTVDWVVLTAAIIIVTVSAFVVIKQSSDAMGASIGTYLTEADQDRVVEVLKSALA